MKNIYSSNRITKTSEFESNYMFKAIAIASVGLIVSNIILMLIN